MLPLLFCEMLPSAASMLTTTILPHLNRSDQSHETRVDRLGVPDWTLLPSEAALLADKTGPTRLGFAHLNGRPRTCARSLLLNCNGLLFLVQQGNVLKEEAPSKIRDRQPPDFVQRDSGPNLKIVVMSATLS